MAKATKKKTNAKSKSASKPAKKAAAKKPTAKKVVKVKAPKASAKKAPTKAAAKKTAKPAKKAAAKVSKQTKAKAAKTKSSSALKTAGKVAASATTVAVAAVAAKSASKSASKALASIVNMFSPLDDRLIVEREAHATRTAGGLYIPDSVGPEDRPKQGKVLAVGRGHRDAKGRLRPLDVRLGDTVVFDAYSGTEIKIMDRDLVVLRESNVLGVIKG